MVRSRPALKPYLLIFYVTACGSGNGTGEAGHAEPEAVYLDAPSGELPGTMRELGLHPEPGDFARVHASALEFRPAYELWSNGSAKQRYLVLPPGRAVDNRVRGQWDFPAGTLFFKTFFYPGAAGTPLPVETRVLERTEQGYDFAVYAWNAEGTDADRLALDRPVPVRVEIDGEAFDHVIPTKLDCRKCHESQAIAVIGFDELRLNTPLETGLPTQLEDLAARGIFAAPMPEGPEVIRHADTLTATALGYLHGNCAHCHNGGDGASSAFDMRHPVALENLVNRETEGEALAGIRIVPGEPEQSALYLAFTRDESIPNIQPMPPVGVQRVDSGALEMLADFIRSLAEPGDDAP